MLSGGNSDDQPGLYTAIQEQLGLKIVPTKSPGEVLVIDHLEPASANQGGSGRSPAAPWPRQDEAGNQTDGLRGMG